jgi:hypothetical protein
MIKVDFSEIDGRGVFATQDIGIGTELTCDVMIFENDVKFLEKWTYPWDKDHFSFCVGFGSFFNHSQIPNVKIKSVDKKRLTKTFVVINDIKEGEELLLCYGKNKFFESLKIDL